MIPPDFVALTSLCGIAISTLMQLVLSWIFMYFFFSDGESLRLVKNTEIGLVIKPRHPTSIGNTLVIQSFSANCSCRSSYFSNLRWCAQSKFSLKKTVNSITKTFFNLTYQTTISGRWIVNATSVGNRKWCSKLVVMCQSVQPSSNDDLCFFSRESFEIFPSLRKRIALLVILLRALMAISRHNFTAPAKISRTSLCLHL